MEGCRVLWGDFHTHLTELDLGDELLRQAAENIDFNTVLCYPFDWDTVNGFEVESVRQRPEFLEWWKVHTRLAADHYAPGKFTTFLGYEWHGNRTRWGDHNVIYRDAVGELGPDWELEELYDRLRGTPAFAIPHHTAYHLARRGKDWDVWDREISPVMEIYSGHGSSEGPDTPKQLTHNSSMGPRSSGNSYQEALARGIRTGVIGSNDGWGLPGRWNMGRAAVWAADNTREAIWDGISARRTYAVTGDRILLDFDVAGIPMGSEGKSVGPVGAKVSVVGSHAIDRIELLRNGIVAATYCHSGRWERTTGAKRFKFRFVAGWGPCTQYGYKPPETWPWDCKLEIDGGTLVGVERCFDMMGQTVPVIEPHRCEWHLETTARRIRNPQGMTQGLIFDIEGGPETRLHIEAEGETLGMSVGELARRPHLFPMLAESKRRALDTFGVDPDTVENPDSYFHNARKIKLHRAVPETAWRVEHTFGDLELDQGTNTFYVRVTQTNGQVAWSSPVWIEKGA
ncbi:MAG TPA: DUF3604 domain-containing protein [Planctomycetota bacterium]|nr:DUF3604 domain-containing protein [Planctomycetota bacterium]